MYIAIAGNIGSGKTTLTQILTKRYDAKCYLEECDNPYIGDFYEDMNRWAFNLQISFLGSRIQQTMDMISDCKSGVIFHPVCRRNFCVKAALMSCFLWICPMEPSAGRFWKFT